MELKFDGYDAIVEIRDDGTEAVVYDGLDELPAKIIIEFINSVEHYEAECHRLSNIIDEQNTVIVELQTELMKGNESCTN